MISIAHPCLGVEEETAILRVLASGQLAQGEQVARFEQCFANACQVREAVAVSSGTAALQLALQAHNIGPGDEVITTAFSFAATVSAILLVGATPVFVDIEPETYTLDPTLVESALTERTKAILPVHLYGHPCDMKFLEQLAMAHDLILIEDACQAHIAAIEGKPVGSFGTGCFSFYATKNMTAGEGGMVTTNDPEVAERVRLLRNHGQKERYKHLILGHNLRMTEMQAALGLVQLGQLEQFTRQRITNANFLNKHLSNAVQTPRVHAGYRHVYNQYTIRTPGKRDEWVTTLRMRGIGVGVYYPIPIYQQPYYRDLIVHHRAPDLCGVANKAQETHTLYLPETEVAAQEVLSLPIHPALREEDLSTIAREVLKLCD
jgi:perosamine synthetase